ncbi:UrcA family protein [Sandarakinorhabdus sp.]|uniref:UrcA family protein n=1 Tax=Sandarakinorhabdus sp. TaxID=1916663 RepID=UPI00286E80BB|nr:UrcA family protein [Sandarakinorhabdus sp.]
MFIVRTAIAAASLAVVLIATPVFAQERGHSTWAVNVQTADLALGTSDGKRMLDRRLDAALVRLCGQPVFFSRDELAALDACKAQARSMADTQVQAAVARAGTQIAAK